MYLLVRAALLLLICGTDAQSDSSTSTYKRSCNTVLLSERVKIEMPTQCDRIIILSRIQLRCDDLSVSTTNIIIIIYTHIIYNLAITSQLEFQWTNGGITIIIECTY